MVVAVILAVTLGGSTRPAVAVTISGGTPEQREMARWAVARFRAAGLTLPRIELRFNEGDREACRGHLGYYENGVADLCGTHTDHLASRLILHEMAHGWLEVNVTSEQRDRFLALRGLTTWNDEEAGWEKRGFEQGAEIVAWAIGDQSGGTRAPSFPENARRQLAEAYEVLTDEPLPELAPAMMWHGAV